MIKPTFKEFLAFSKRANLIPVFEEINADLDTPVSALLKIGNEKYSFLLESVEGQEHIARYSFLGNKPAMVFQSKGQQIQISYPEGKKVIRFKTKKTPLDEMRSVMQDFRCIENPELPRFFGGLVGYMGYDTVRFFEKIPNKNKDDLGLPDTLFMLTDTILIFDHVSHTIKIVANVILKSAKTKDKKALYQQAVAKISCIKEALSSPSFERFRQSKSMPIKPGSNFTKGSFQKLIRRVKKYIKDGDIIQAVLSQRFKVRTSKAPLGIYRSLRSLNPSPYMFYLNFKDFYLIGSSPEMLVRCENNLIETRPIAGTRSRGIDEKEDAALERELGRDKKEKAEHLMLVDLGRNDLGRLCRPGTVKVSEFMSVEKYSHVMHLVSQVKGRLDSKRFDVYDILKYTFPAGTVSGSPKIRAMEIIDEQENLRRGPYAGCVGYFSFTHNMDTCITIRTILLTKQVAYIQAGSGIVADSVPQKEYFETVNKAKALMEAIAH